MSRARSAVARLLSALPRFRGKGRITLALDRVLTDASDPRSYIAVGRLNGHPFELDLRPWGQKFAFYYGQWEADLIGALQRLYRGGTFIDVGSSIGLYVVAFGPAVRQRGGRIVSIEPVPRNVARQRRNIELNRLEDIVELIEVAVGDRAGALPMQTDDEGGDNNAFFTESGSLTVPIVTLDQLADERQLPPVTTMKIDVEGFEPFVIAGAARLIERERPAILAEFCRERMAINGCRMEETWERFRAWRYCAFRLQGGRLIQLDAPGEWENLFLLPEEMRSSMMA